MNLSLKILGVKDGNKCDVASLFNELFGVKTLVVMHHYIWVTLRSAGVSGSSPEADAASKRLRSSRTHL